MKHSYNSAKNECIEGGVSTMHVANLTSNILPTISWQWPAYSLVHLYPASWIHLRIIFNQYWMN